ncbi:hypothetical protein BDV12DRAFT_58978 [Aspergillus spectabilis]
MCTTALMIFYLIPLILPSQSSHTSPSFKAVHGLDLSSADTHKGSAGRQPWKWRMPRDISIGATTRKKLRFEGQYFAHKPTQLLIIFHILSYTPHSY